MTIATSGTHIALLVLLTAETGCHLRTGRELHEESGEIRNESFSIPLRNVAQSELKIRFGVGELQVFSHDSSNLLEADGSFRSTAERPFVEDGFGPGRCAVTIGTPAEDLLGPGRFDETTDRWELRLCREALLDLDLDLGAGEGNVDLSGTRLRSLRIEVGAGSLDLAVEEPNPDSLTTAVVEVSAGEARLRGLGNLNFESFQFEGSVGEYSLDFLGLWHRSAVASVEVSVGELRIQVPSDIGVSLSADTHLGSLEVPSGYRCEDGRWVNEAYHRAAVRFDLKATVVLGSVTLVEAS